MENFDIFNLIGLIVMMLPFYYMFHTSRKTDGFGSACASTFILGIAVFMINMGWYMFIGDVHITFS